MSTQKKKVKTYTAYDKESIFIVSIKYKSQIAPSYLIARFTARSHCKNGIESNQDEEKADKSP